ncbi:hypothetical protein D4F06_25620 [Salmonella enterica subsp. enterica serovar Muenchen]|nr:hypothetical protein [Salmonella enterica subsp. diarizonae serovar 48:i:z]EBW7189845.1 hypothetical protein [Salmonella enterica subsp. enterica serovar Muenchen]EBX4463228.1 hypothetical protein [Salmonella enterica subsp. enterica serovar Muenchen]EBY3557633.1 hypothetical protein [Salmonella enterica subsp. enterica serovar Muenchen]EDO3660313.1 hypothetical protein [Salmonella enterica]
MADIRFFLPTRKGADVRRVFSGENVWKIDTMDNANDEAGHKPARCTFSILFMVINRLATD